LGRGGRVVSHPAFSLGCPRVGLEVDWEGEGA